MDKPPDSKDGRDAVYEIGRALVSVVPAAGGPLQVAFENIFSSPLEKRRQAWLEELAEVCTNLQSRYEELTPEALAANEAFVTITMHASQMALRNHQKEKLDALRNAVFNAGLPGNYHEDEQMVFLHLVDSLTPLHLRILSLLKNPGEWMERNKVMNSGWAANVGLTTILDRCFPDLAGDHDTYRQVVRELQIYGLVDQGEIIHTMMTISGALASKTTARGNRFMEFISEPN